jgi:hypothetical protein
MRERMERAKEKIEARQGEYGWRKEQGVRQRHAVTYECV